jgi:hypothetical protein
MRFAAGLKPSASATKAACAACSSPPGTLWVLGFVMAAEGFSPAGGERPCKSHRISAARPSGKLAGDFQSAESSFPKG